MHIVGVEKWLGEGIDAEAVEDVENRCRGC
jgi:hypothetical protein